MSEERFASIWDAVEKTPAEAEKMKLRAALMTALRDHIKARKWTQAEAARHLGITQPRVSDLMRGKVSLFGIDALVTLLSAAGLSVEVHVRRAA